MSSMEIVWLIAVIAFGILEAVTVQFVCIWFAGGALLAMIASLLGAGTLVQCIVFVAVSAILLFLTRSLVRKLTKGGMEKTNADSLIGKSLVVIKATDSLGENGKVKAGGTVWTVRTEDGKPVSEGEAVTVEKIEGVKLIVKK